MRAILRRSLLVFLTPVVVLVFLVVGLFVGVCIVYLDLGIIYLTPVLEIA